jgi:glutathione S-transferase
VAQITRHDAASIKLWGRLSSCNVQKALWVLEELNLPYTRMDAGGDFGGLDDPAYLAMNPHGRVPTLVDGDVTVWESDAIVRYVAARYGAGRLWPDTPQARAVADQWMAWTAASLYPHWIKLFWKLVRTPSAKRDKAAIASHRAAAARCFEVLDRHLAGHRYLAGDGFGMADIPAGVMLYRWFEMDIERPVTPNVEAWYSRLLERRAYKSAVCLPFDDLIGKESF